MTAKKTSGGGIWILAAALLILAAAAAGYFFAKGYGERGSGDGPAAGAPDTVQDGGGNAPAGTSYSALNMTPVELLFVTNSETGRIEHMLLAVLNCAAGKLNLIGIDTDVSCTMSGKLYSELTPGNTELPQTVTFSELYRYYRNDRAYEAGRRIFGELINFNIPYYAAVEDVVFDEFMYYNDTGAGFRLSADELKGRDYGTEGSVKGALDRAFADAVTNFGISDRLRYLEVYDALTNGDVVFDEAPVKEKNESTSLDTVGTGAILYGILY